MAFITDKQTITDLNIFGRRDQNSVYGIYNTTRTRGGARLLDEMFLHPLSNEKEICRRSEIITHFYRNKSMFPFRGELFDTFEHYLSNKDNRSRLAVEENTLQRKLKGVIGADTAFDQLRKGVFAGLEILHVTRDFIDGMKDSDQSPYGEEARWIKEFLGEEAIARLCKAGALKKLSYEKTVEVDTMLRFSLRGKLLALLNKIYHLDLYIAVAEVAVKRGFSFARVSHDNDGESLTIEAMFHPAVPNAVPNSLTVNQSNNVLFLTGANMAGKSTFMKTLGITLYLAHMGFPVPAASMTFPVMDGMFTTINLPDNLGMGYSHFYAEVLRVKKVANELKHAKRLLVIFDELFRGTNVKDAHDATVAITGAFATNKECLFVISTHIVEAGEILRSMCDGVDFVYFPTQMEGNTPRYTYTLAPGITSDRHGMLIIQNEKLLNILEEENNAPRRHKEEFTTDKQTLEDLNLLGEFRPNSIFNIFNKTRTRCGKRILETMFRQPMTDAEEINNRAAIFDFFGKTQLEFPVENALFERVDLYLSGSGENNRLQAFVNTCQRKLLEKIGNDTRHETIKNGFYACVEFLREVKGFVQAMTRGDIPASYRPTADRLVAFFADKRLAWVFRENERQNKSLFRFVNEDYCLRSRLREEMRLLMNEFYLFDVYLSVSGVARENGFSYAKAMRAENTENNISMREVWHPSIKKAVRNTINMNRSRNALFLTGANMAGKSTLMKSFATAIYLAHMGFPVAAEEMEFSVQEGIYTSINVSDNLNMGYSHYYAEVLRVKQVAQQVAGGKNIVVVFDELFKGTNVKDAYDATVALSEAFAKKRNCMFVVSTHIVEAGHELMNRLDNIKFVFVPTVMRDNLPTYPYRLQEGITDDRHGMVIIRNEGVLEMLENAEA